MDHYSRLDRQASGGIISAGRPVVERSVTMTRAYVLIEAAVGKAKSVAEGVQNLQLTESRVVSVDAVTGPFDVIALLESDDLDKVGRAITEGIQQVDGVQRTTTCLVVQLS
jgi:DNA-binding Lrp family transcriptional regulator